MTEFYRFRSREKLLDPCFEELERQTVFFASPDDLNDPMEGFQDLVWSGDHIVWANLLKNYVHCLSWTCTNALVFGNEYNLDPGHIPIRLPAGSARYIAILRKCVSGFTSTPL